jgi:hypothetical protein
VKVFDLDELGEPGSPVMVLDDFRVRGQPFPPHPHAGFSAVTYVFEDSQGSLRSRDSLGNDVVVGPGGVVWTLAGSGVIHHEVPAQDDRELHGLQLFVNLSAKNKFAAPRMLRLAKNEVPEWRSEVGDRVRVVVGSFEGVASSLAPVEPFDLLDIELRREVVFALTSGRRAIVYVVDGEFVVRADGAAQKVQGGTAIALRGEGQVKFEAVGPSHVVILSGAEIHEPVVSDGPFIMNDQSQIAAAGARYQAGQMGSLAPLA